MVAFGVDVVGEIDQRLVAAEQRRDPPLPGQQRRGSEHEPGEGRRAGGSAEDADLRLLEARAVERECRHQQRDGEPDAGDRPRAEDGRPADRGAQATAREPRHEQRHADDSKRLADHVAEQDAERDRRAGRALEEAAVDRDARVREREHRDDHVARPRVIEGQQPLVRRDRRAEALARRALELRRGLLAELAEALAGALELRPGDGIGPHQQAHGKAQDDRLDAGLEQRDPGRGSEHEVHADRCGCGARGREHPAKKPTAQSSAASSSVFGVRGRDHHQREEVVDHDHREDERPQALRHAARRPARAIRAPGRCRSDIAIPQPCADELPRVEREVDRDRGAPSPRSRRAAGSARRRRSRSSPRSNSRRASRPSTKKKNVIRPLFTHSRSVSWIPRPRA